MQISDPHIGADDALAIQPQHHPQHAVRARMLRPHVEDELVGVEHGLRLGCWFHCASFTPRTGQRSKVKREVRSKVLSPGTRYRSKVSVQGQTCRPATWTCNLLLAP